MKAGCKAGSLGDPVCMLYVDLVVLDKPEQVHMYIYIFIHTNTVCSVAIVYPEIVLGKCTCMKYCYKN